jgi:hypothetical protein
VTYNIDHRRFLPCSIVAQNPRYVRNRDEWEKKRSLLLYSNKPHDKPVQAIQGSTSKVFDQLALSATLGLMVCRIATGICMFAANNISGIFSSPEL